MKYLIFSTQFIRNNWDGHFKQWTDVESVDEYLKKAKAGDIILGGAKLIVQDKLPAC